MSYAALFLQKANAKTQGTVPKSNQLFPFNNRITGFTGNPKGRYFFNVNELDLLESVGLDKPFKPREMVKYLKNHKVCLAGLLETKIKEPKFLTSLNKVATRWHDAHNYSHVENEKIWVIWKAIEVEVVIQETHEQYIPCIVAAKRTNFKCTATIVYGSNSLGDREKLLERFKEIGCKHINP